MIVAHLSDLHLGFRAYGRVESDVNLRERDVYAAFERTVDLLCRIRPDVVVFAGDVFDRPDPPAGAIVAIARGLEVLRTALADTPVLMVAGPRDTARRPGDPGALAVLDTFSNVEAATGLMRSILIERLNLHVCLVPHRAAAAYPGVIPEPDPRQRWNLLVVHAAEVIAGGRGVQVDPSEWDYVALGGSHRRHAVAPRTRYSGAIERVALDPWDEATDEKGFLTVDLGDGQATFHAIPGRPVVALAPIKAGTGDPERVLRKVREVTAEVPGGIEGKIVRVRLLGAVSGDVLALQGAPLEALRARALHLTVEATPEPRVPPDAWLRPDLPGLVREAVVAELARDDALSSDVRSVLDRWLPEREIPIPAPIGVFETIDGTLAGIGRVSTSVPEGVTALFGGSARTRRALADLVRERVPGEGALERLWRGVDSETLDGALASSVAAVASSRGGDLIDEPLTHAGVLPGGSESPDGRSGRSSVDPPVTGGPTPVPSTPSAERTREELVAAERQLRELRADVAEVDGDLEVATMDWLRERQDAETTLNTYRDQARELRTRIREMEVSGPEAPCPTCGRTLSEHYEDVLMRLRDQWEGVVQDGSWWRRRWTQLELKPDHLRELEGRAIRLHAAMEGGSERVEILRARLEERLGDAASHPRTAVPAGSPEAALVAALVRVRSARLARAREMVIERASRFLCRMTGGRILAVTEADGEARLQGAAAALTSLAEEDLAVARLAIRLAGASLVAAEGRVLASLPVEEPFDRLDDETRVRTLLLLKRLLRDVPRIVLFVRSSVVEVLPERFDYLLEVRADGGPHGPVLRPVTSGPGRLVLKRHGRPGNARSAIGATHAR